MTDLTPTLIEKMLAHVGPDPDPAFGDVAYNNDGYVEAIPIADAILADQRTRTEAADPDTEALRLLTLLVEPDSDGSEEDIDRLVALAWGKAVRRFESKLNDAELLGTETPAFVSILDQPATLMTGELWGAKDRRNTQDGDWKPVTLSWREWINGGASTKNAPAWGFSRHPMGKHKEGACNILGASVEGSCNAKDMETMSAIGVDFDSGVELDDLIDKVEAEGLLCLIYTSHSHGKTTLELKRDAVIQRRKVKGAPTIEDVRNYLRYDGKDQYSEEFLSKIEIAQDKKQVKGGVVIVLQTPPQVKVRAIFPLVSPVKLIDLAETHSAALDLWTDKTTGFASKVLGFPFDTSCTDAGRRFYTARHREGAEWDCVVIRGNPLDFNSIPVVRKQTYLDARKAGGGDNPYVTASGVGAGYSDRANVLAPSGLSLSEWHSKAKDRFKITEVIEDHCREQVRSGSGDKIYIHCPFGDHDAGGETSTYAKNPDHTADDDKGRYWTIRCSHDTCQGRHKLDFLAEMLRQQWFDESELFGDSVYMLEGPDEAPEPRKKQKPKGRSKTGIEACHIKADYPDQLDYARRRIVEANTECPRLFQFGGAYATADAVRHRIRLIEDRDSLHYVLQDVTRWEKTEKVGDDYVTRLVAPPESVVRAIYKDHVFADTLPEILAVQSTPFFDAEGRLVAEDGYHAGAKVYLAKGDLVLPGVSREPSAEEVTEAKRLIVEEVLADFPLGGMDRAEIVETLTADSPNAHAVTHAVAMTLLPFCRDMIAGPTPGHVYTKPGPGTGASLLVDVLTTIAGGSPAPAMTFPTRAEEVGKTLSAALAEGAPVILFDNIGQALASSELASAMTGTKYQARILGKTQLVMVPVRTVWTFTANNIEASREILRRFVLIPLDAGVPDPEQRTPKNGWRHPNLRQWVTDNRPVLVWACLTLIQHWVARGMVRQSAASLASYEDWAGVMGGILAEAGFHGFLGGQTEERAKATDATEDGLAQLVRLMSEYPDGTVFRPGGTGRYEKKPTVSVMEILNGDDRAKIEPGDKPDPIPINGWGYKDFDGRYTTSGKIGRGMKALARKPYQIGRRVVAFAEAADTKGGTSVYRMSKTE